MKSYLIENEEMNKYNGNNEVSYSKLGVQHNNSVKLDINRNLLLQKSFSLKETNIRRIAKQLRKTLNYLFELIFSIQEL